MSTADEDSNDEKKQEEIQTYMDETFDIRRSFITIETLDGPGTTSAVIIALFRLGLCDMASHLKRDRTFTLSLSAKECVKVLKSAENFEFQNVHSG
jgi:hypothetical protein